MLLEWFWRLWAGWGRSERRVGIPFPWGMRLGLILAEWRTAVAGDPENQPGTLAFTHCLPAGHPQHQSDGFRFSSLEGEGRDRTDIVTAWLKTFPFDVLFFLRGGGEGQDSCRFFLCWHRDPRVGSLPFPPCFVLCLWLELGTSPWRDRTGTVLCSPAPGSPGLCRDSHSTSTFLSLSFPSFSPFLSLLSPHLPSTPPTLPMGCTRWHFTGRPPPKPQICTVFYFPEQTKKRCRMLPGVGAGDQNFPKTEQIHFLFCPKSSCCSLGWAEGIVLCQRWWQQKSKWAGALWFLPVPINCKLGVGGRGRNNEVFN